MFADLQILAAAGYDADEMRDERLVEVHHVVDVPVRSVELEHRKLGIVARVDAFIAEDATDLVDPFQSADDQALEVKLGRDPQLHLFTRERVDVGDERPRRCTAGNVQQRRGFDFVEAAIVDEPSRFGDDAAAHDHRVAHVRIHDQVDVALTVAFLDVREAMPLVRERHQRFAQQFERLDVERQLALFRAKHEAAHAHDITALDVVPFREAFVAQIVFAQVDL